MNDEDNSTVHDTFQKEAMYEVPLDLPEENEDNSNIHDTFQKEAMYEVPLDLPEENEDNSTVHDTFQKEAMYEAPLDLPEEKEVPLYYNIHEDLRSEKEALAMELESHEYNSVSVYVAEGEKESLTSSQPEAGDYLLPDDICPESQDLQPGEPPVSSEDWNSSMEKLPSPAQYQEELHSPAQDQEELQSPAEDQELPPPAQDQGPQEDGGVMEKDLPSPTFPTRQSRAFFPSKKSSTRYSAAADLKGNESTSTDPEITLFVKKIQCNQSTRARAQSIQQHKGQMDHSTVVHNGRTVVFS